MEVRGIYLVDTDKLEPHPLLAEHFQPGTKEEIQDLKESIKRVGIIHPIVATKDGKIISGRDRRTSGKEMGLKSLPVRFMNFKTPEIEEAAMLAANLHVRGLSPAVVARGRGRLDEIWGKTNGVDREALSKLTASERREVERAFKRELNEATERASLGAVKKAAEDYEKRLKLLTQENKNLKSSLEELMAERDKAQERLADQGSEVEKLNRQLASIREQKEEFKRDKEKLERELKGLREKIGSSSARVEEGAKELNGKARRLVALALQVTRIGPETILPCVLEFLEGKEKRKAEIMGATAKLTSWCREMEGLLDVQS